MELLYKHNRTRCVGPLGQPLWFEVIHVYFCCMPFLDYYFWYESCTLHFPVDTECQIPISWNPWDFFFNSKIFLRSEEKYRVGRVPQNQYGTCFPFLLNKSLQMLPMFYYYHYWTHTYTYFLMLMNNLCQLIVFVISSLNICGFFAVIYTG